MGIAAAAGTDRTIEVNGKKYKFRRITVDDIAELAEHLKSRRLESLKVILDALSPEERREFTKDTMSADISDDELTEAMRRMDGIAFLLRRALKVNKGITDEEIDELLRLDTMAENFNAILGAGSKEGENPPPASPQESG